MQRRHRRRVRVVGGEHLLEIGEPDPAGGDVAEHVLADQRRQQPPAVDEPATDRVAAVRRVLVLHDRVRRLHHPLRLLYPKSGRESRPPRAAARSCCPLAGADCPPAPDSHSWRPCGRCRSSPTCRVRCWPQSGDSCRLAGSTSQVSRCGLRNPYAQISWRAPATSTNGLSRGIRYRPFSLSVVVCGCSDEVGHDAEDLADQGVEPLRVLPHRARLLARTSVAAGDVEHAPVRIAGPRGRIEDEVTRRMDARVRLDAQNLARGAFEGRVADVRCRSTRSARLRAGSSPGVLIAAVGV